MINRVTILCDRFTGHPKGYVPSPEHRVFLMCVSRYAYVEFAEPEHVDAAVAMDNSLFRGRLLKVCVSLVSRRVLTGPRSRQNAPMSLASTVVVAVGGQATEVGIAEATVASHPMLVVEDGACFICIFECY